MEAGPPLTHVKLQGFKSTLQLLLRLVIGSVAENIPS